MAADIKCAFCKEVYRYVNSERYGTYFKDWDCINRLYNLIFVEETAGECEISDSLLCAISDAGTDVVDPNIITVKACNLSVIGVTTAVSCPSITVS